MSSAWMLGGVAGVMAAAVSVAANLWRGDPHLVSTAPDLATLMIVVGLVWFTVRSARARAGEPSGRAGLVAALMASGTFATCMGAFAWWYLPSHALVLAAAAGLSGFALTVVVGIVAARTQAARAA